MHMILIYLNNQYNYPKYNVIILCTVKIIAAAMPGHNVCDLTKDECGVLSVGPNSVLLE